MLDLACHYQRKTPKPISAEGLSPLLTNGITICQTRKSALSQEDIEALPYIIMNTNQAKKYLAKNLLYHFNQQFTLYHITSTLFHITQLKAIPLPVIEAIRSVAFILKLYKANKIAELASKHITTNLTPKIAEHVIAAIAPQVVKILTMSESLNNIFMESDRIRLMMERETEERNGNMNTAVEHFKETVGKLLDSIEECKRSMKLLLPSLDKSIKHLSQVLQATTLANDNMIPNSINDHHTAH